MMKASRAAKFLGLIAVIAWAVFEGPAVSVNAAVEGGMIQRGWGRDPFVPLDYERAAVAAKEKLMPEAETKDESYWLSGVLYRKGRSVAIINRVLVREGDEIFGAKVVKILPDRVLMSKAGKEIIIRLGVG